MAAKAPAFGPLINPADDRFIAPSDMVVTIQSFCKQTDQNVPSDKGSIVRCILESLAMEYRFVTELIDELTGVKHPIIHIIGGGSQNTLLNSMTANATGRTVMAGPVEATAIGNILVQMVTSGDINSLSEGREIVRNSFDFKIYEPKDTSCWDDLYHKYRTLRNKG
jgi:rhamnulokinase